MNERAWSPGGIVVVFSRPSDFAQEKDWDGWYSDRHLPATVERSGARVATRWENTDRPHMAVSPVGFTHVVIYEFDDITAGAPALLDLFETPGEGDFQHPVHTIIA